MKKIFVIGLGNFGKTLAVRLAALHCEVVAIDSNGGKVEDVKDTVAHAFVGDACDKDVLDKIGFRDFDMVCVSLGDNVAGSILLVSALKEAGVARIIAKATSEEHARVLKKVGASEVVFPERDEATRLANSIANPDVLELIRLSDAYDIIELAAPPEFINKTLKDLDLMRQYGIQVLASRNLLSGEVQISPHFNYRVNPDDVLVVLGKVESLDRLSKKK